MHSKEARDFHLVGGEEESRAKARDWPLMTIPKVQLSGAEVVAPVAVHPVTAKGLVS